MTRLSGEFWDEILGAPGTPQRIRADASIAEERARMGRARRATHWLERIPAIGHLAGTFWFLALTESLPGLLDGLEFSYLNDGYRPTLWHTWYSMTHDNAGLFSGIWPGGAPRSRRDAYAKQVAAAIERDDFA